jgi:hypothetical protein
MKTCVKKETGSILLEWRGVNGKADARLAGEGSEDGALEGRSTGSICPSHITSLTEK